MLSDELGGVSGESERARRGVSENVNCKNVSLGGNVLSEKPTETKDEKLKSY